MKNIVLNVVAVLLGLIIAGAVNMSLVLLGPYVIPPPPGADMTTAEGLTAAMPLLEPKHFIFPFLAHAVGTFVGAFVAALLAASHRKAIAIGVGLFFLAGGVAAAFMIPAPLWFVVVDLLFAYTPMGWLAGTLAARVRKTQ